MTVHLEKVRVLIADDDPMAADLEAHLRNLGHAPIGLAESSDQALELLARERPDLVLMDIALHGETDAVEAAGIIRDRWGVPVVFITSDDGIDRLNAARRTYPFAYVLRPIQDRELKAAVEKALNRAERKANEASPDETAAKESLRHGEQQFREMFENAPIGVFQTNLTGRALKINHTMASILGWPSPEEALAFYLDLGGQLYVAPDRRQKFVEMLTKNGKVEAFEFRARRKDGRIIWLSMDAILNAKTGVINGFASDITQRKETEEALRESEQRHRALFNATTDAVYAFYLTDDWMPGAIFEVNEYVCRLLGYSRAELLGMEVKDVRAPETITDVGAVMEDLKSGMPIQFEQMHLAKDGTRIHVEINAHLFEYRGRPAVYSTVRDIRGRDQLAVHLRQLSGRFQGLLDHSPALISMVDTEGRYLLVNRALCSLLRAAPENLLGRSFLEVMRPEDPRTFQDRLKLIVKQRTPLTVEDPLKLEGKEYILSSTLFPIFDAHRQVEAIGIMASDVTDQSRAEQALRESEARFRSVIESAPDAIFVQIDGRFAYFNPAAMHLFGIEKEEDLLGKSVLQALPPENHDIIQNRINILNEQRLPTARLLHQYVRTDGSRVDVESTAVPIDFQGRNGALVFARNVTEQKKLETQLRHAHKMEAIGTLTGGISHDFNNILQAINGYTQILQMDRDENDPDYPSLKAIHNAASRAAQLVSKLMLFSRSALTEKKPVALNQEVEQARRLLETNHTEND